MSRLSKSFAQMQRLNVQRNFATFASQCIIFARDYSDVRVLPTIGVSNPIDFTFGDANAIGGINQLSLQLEFLQDIITSLESRIVVWFNGLGEKVVGTIDAVYTEDTQGIVNIRFNKTDGQVVVPAHSGYMDDDDE